MSNKQYYQEHREEIIARVKIYASKNQEKIQDYRRVYTEKNREKIRKHHQEYYIKNKEKILAQKQEYNYQNRFIRITNARASRYKNRYKITPEDYDRMFIEQSGHCAICGTHQSKLKRALCVDHNHQNGKTRKLLCDPCNLGLSYFKEDIRLLENAVEYLKQH